MTLYSIHGWRQELVRARRWMTMLGRSNRWFGGLWIIVLAPACDGTNAVGNGGLGGTGSSELAPVGGAQSSTNENGEGEYSFNPGSSLGGSGSTGQARQYSYQLPAGFERYAELGDDCAAAYAVNPQTALGQLSFIPCTSGTSECEQMVTSSLGGATPPSGSTFSGGYAYQIARDPDGNFERLVVEYVPDTLDRSFQSAVVYDVATGKLVAGWRNALRDVSVVQSGANQSSPTLVNNTGTLTCEIHPLLGHDTVWIIAKPAHSSELKVAHGPLTDPASTTKFGALEVDDSILADKILASDDALAMAQSDGKITVVYADGRHISAYGPSMRVWLHSMVGTDVITFNDEASTGTKYFRLDSLGQFTAIAPSAVLLGVDGKQAAWSAESTTSSSFDKTTTPIWTAPYLPVMQGDAESGTLLSSVESDPLFDELCSPILTNGWFSVATNCEGSGGAPKVLSTDVATGAVRVTTLPSRSLSSDRFENTLALFAVTDTRVWFARKSLGDAYYYELQRKVLASK